ncbi:MAG: flagellar export chaperone FliS [Peptococcaceae bacterium]|nr:flagellar export chaperone FliS [Peptococcaceae bacterium]
MTKGELLILLYDEWIKRMRRAVIAIEDNDTIQAHEAIVRSQDIIDYLMATLDPKYPISTELARLYDFFKYQLVEANIKKDKTMIEAIIPMVTDLRDTWKEANKISQGQ